MKIPTEAEIQAAAERCRARFAAVPDATHGAHIHHAPIGGQYIEALTEAIENRIQFILTQKAVEERVIRLDAMRPATVAEVALDAEHRPKWDALYAEYQQKWDALDAEYRPKWDALYAEYQPKWDALYAEYRQKRDALTAEYRQKRDALYAEYRRKWDALDAEYRQKRDALDAEYRPKWDALYAEYRQKWDALHKSECTPDCPWDGMTLFPGVTA